MQLEERLAPTLRPDLRGAFEHAPFGVALIDSEGVIVWTNQTLVTLLGEADDSTLLHSLVDVRLGENEGSAWREMLTAHFMTPPKARQPRTGRFDLGSAMGLIQTVEITLMPYDGCGESHHDERNHECALAYVISLGRQLVAERRFNQIFESLPIGLLVADTAQRIVKVNTRLAEDFGYRPEELVGQPVAQLLPERFRSLHEGNVRAYIAEPETRLIGVDRDVTGQHRSGQEFPVEIALTRLENMRLPLFLALISDVSARKRSETALQQTNLQLEEFTYIASHDLRSPLRGIADLVGWIREDLGEDAIPEEVKHNFDRISLRIARSEQMIDDLLTYARAGNRDLVTEMVDPVDLVDEAVTTAVLPGTFRVETEVKAAPFLTPRAPLATSLRNLVANAVKHHGEAHGRIRITVREEGRFAIFTVDDDGKGIPAGAEERIFKLFHRASTDTPGDGVGLAFTRRMVLTHGGTITVAGHGPLGGASFMIHWPRIMLREGGHG
ncbi:sensor histidine kinase [Novosphingobium sp. 9]|uniref:sensor histidine kinase n=1 Tax=Novosphingobium sp. 9 TaxID=2025349 RepID=UPI0021B5EF35|nr:PAS domain S-box protein [Novosphingobium sp. 9]